MGAGYGACTTLDLDNNEYTPVVCVSSKIFTGLLARLILF